MSECVCVCLTLSLSHTHTRTLFLSLTLFHRSYRRFVGSIVNIHQFTCLEPTTDCETKKEENVGASESVARPGTVRLARVQCNVKAAVISPTRQPA